MLVLVFLVALVAGQSCPYCRSQACLPVRDGSTLYGCSSCVVGTLVQLTFVDHKLGYQCPVGVCQLCPSNCDKCQQALIVPSMASPFPTLNCTQCHEGYTTDVRFGSCRVCPDNCVQCICVPIAQKYTNLCGRVDCQVCKPGYTLVQGQCQLNARKPQIALNEENILRSAD